MVHLQDSISKYLHHHTLSNLFFDGILEAMVEFYHVLALGRVFGL
jgi:hypothetical protein